MPLCIVDCGIRSVFLGKARPIQTKWGCGMSWTLRGAAGTAVAAVILAVPAGISAQTSSSSFSPSAPVVVEHRPEAPVTKPDQPSPTDFREIPEEGPYLPMDGRQRLQWFAVETAGPASLAGGLFTAGIRTAGNQPREYGAHWDGYSKRYAMELPSIAAGNLLEAGLGSLWGEDPRYTRHGSDPFAKRLGHVFLMTVSAKRKDGHLAPAYARYVAISGSSFLSNAWWARSESHASDALIRTGYGLMGRLVANAWCEFWPSVRPHILPWRR